MHFRTMKTTAGEAECCGRCDSSRARVCVCVGGVSHSPGHTNPVGASEWACYAELRFQVSGLEHAWLQLPLPILTGKGAIRRGLRGTISGEEETVEELTRGGPYACPLDCPPSGSSLSRCLSALSLHIHAASPAASECRDTGLPPSRQPHVFLGTDGAVRLDQRTVKRPVEPDSG